MALGARKINALQKAKDAIRSLDEAIADLDEGDYTLTLARIPILLKGGNLVTPMGVVFRSHVDKPPRRRTANA